MAIRIIHQINSECDIFVERKGRDHVIVRITERNSELPDPTDFEIEGHPKHISEALATIAGVLVQIEELIQKEPS
jgi:hypothetical protein